MASPIEFLLNEEDRSPNASRRQKSEKHEEVEAGQASHKPKDKGKGKEVVRSPPSEPKGLEAPCDSAYRILPPLTPKSFSESHVLSETEPPGLLPPFQFAPSFGDQYNTSAAFSQFNSCPVPTLPSPPKCSFAASSPNEELPSDLLVPKDFNIFTALLNHPELVFLLAKHLRVDDLISLYAISRDFNDLINTRFTTMILSQSLSKAPESSRVFGFRYYKKLCQEDPAARPNPNKKKAERGEIRPVPSFRWLRMILFREKVVHEIMAIMAEDGVRLPKRCEVTMKKMWFLMDIPDNARRIGILHRNSVWMDLDLYFSQMLFMKLDMRFTDPVNGNANTGLRRMLLAQPSLSTLWKALKRTALISKFDVIKMYVRWKYDPPPEDRGMSIFGIAPEEVGIVQYKNWGRSKSRKLLLRPDELVPRECVRRELKLDKQFLFMFLWGYIDPATLEDYSPREIKRKIDAMDESDDEVVGDDILDLGDKKKISLMVKRDDNDEAWKAARRGWVSDEADGDEEKVEASGSGSAPAPA